MLANTESLCRFRSKLSLFFPSFRLKKIKSFKRFHFLYTDSLDDIVDDLLEELFACNFSIYDQALQNWHTSTAGWIFYFYLKNDPKELKLFLTHPIKKIQYDPAFALGTKKVCTGSKNKGKKIRNEILPKSKKRPKICTKKITWKHLTSTNPTSSTR